MGVSYDAVFNTPRAWLARITRIVLCGALLGLHGVAHSDETPPITFVETDGFPRVVLTPDELHAFRARSWEPWALPIREKILQQADALLDEPLDIPHSEGQWTHWYSCRQDGSRLESLDPQRHICPRCGTVYSGYPYDNVYVSLRHSHWLQGVTTLGMAYALRPERRYAARARDILLEYASFYTDLHLHNKYDQNSPSKARLYAQTLDEAVALCNVVWGYDLVYDSPAFTRIDHGLINRQFIRQMVKTIRGNDAGISNWQSWHNAAVGMAGCLLRDETMVAWALYGKSGFEYQMRRSLMATGMWYEGSPVYHFYALRAYVFLFEAATRAGIPLYEHPKTRTMFEAPLRILLPDGTLPPLNDSDRQNIREQSSFFDIAYRRYGDPAFLPWLAPRNSDWALLWGASEIPAAHPEPAALSTNSASEGLAVLRSPDNRIVAMLDYGPGLSGHVHAAKLNLLLYGLGDILLVDPGRISYGNALQDAWYTQTIAHNAIVVNQTSQTRTRGSFRAFSASPSVIRATCNSAYPGVDIDRTLMLHDNFVLDLVRCSSKRSIIVDLPIHVAGKPVNPPSGEPLTKLGDGNGYPQLRDISRLNTPTSMLEFAANAGRVRIHLPGNATLYTATGLGNPADVRVPMVVQRQEGTVVAFGAVYEILDIGADAVDATAEIAQNGSGWSLSFAGVGIEAGTETVVKTPVGEHVVGTYGLGGSK